MLFRLASKTFFVRFTLTKWGFHQSRLLLDQARAQGDARITNTDVSETIEGCGRAAEATRSPTVVAAIIFDGPFSVVLVPPEGILLRMKYEAILPVIRSGIRI